MTKAALSIAVLCLLAPALGAQSRGEARIAALYREAADNAFERGEKENAIELLQRLLTFDATDVTARLRLVYLLLDDNRLDDSIPDHLHRIQMHTGDPEVLADVAVVEALYFYRIRDFDRVVDVAGATDSLAYVDPRLFSLVIKANHALGRGSLAYSQTEEALERFATHPDVLSAAMTVRGAFLGAEELASLADSGPHRPSTAIPLSERRIFAEKDEAALLLDLALTAASARIAGVVAGHYVAAGGTHPAAYVLEAEAAAAEDAASIEEAVVEAFVEADGGRNLHLIERMAGALPAELRGRVLDLLPATGTVGADYDLDGFYERVFSFEAGALTAVEEDPDQDGRPDVIVRFESGRDASSVEYTAEGLTVEFLDYPRLSALVYRQGLLEARYLLHPRRYREPLVVSDSAADSPAVSAEEMPAALSFGGVRPAPDYSRRMLSEMSYRIVDSTPGGLVSILEHSGGIPVRRLEDDNGDGRIDRIAVFRNGVPSTGVRDLDHDGVFESVVLFDDGVPAALLVDENGDGVPEARERYTDGYLGEWDINEDGIVDASEYRDAAGAVRREFAPVIRGPIDVETWGHLP